MKNYIKYAAALFILFTVVNCSRIQEKVEQKVNEKIDQKVDETLQKLDSAMSRRQIDSMQRVMDSVRIEGDKQFKRHK